MLMKQISLVAVSAVALAGMASSSAQTQTSAPDSDASSEPASKASEFNLRMPGETRPRRSSGGAFNLRLPAEPGRGVQPPRAQTGQASGLQPDQTPDPDDDPDAIIRLPD